MHLFYIFDQRGFVIVPKERQLLLARIFTARQLQGNFKALGPDVVVILHSPLQWVPGVAVDNPVGEVPLVFTLISFCHVGIPGGVGVGQVLENVIVRG